jgi:membrane fusion protein (multidrug efflux system)
MALLLNKLLRHLLLITVISILAIMHYGCSSYSAESSNTSAPPPPQLPVIKVAVAPATTFQEYPASLEGKVNVEIRAQVDGYLQKTFVDEGAYVKAGQPLFKIDDRPYEEQLNNAQSSLQNAQANMQRAQVEVDRLSPLVENNVISDVQLKTAKANYEAAKSSVAQARAVTNSAQIDVGYTIIKAPTSGYIGRLPFKQGSLVGKNDSQPLTLLSDVSEIYAYFSMSEPEFISFRNEFEGNTIEDKVKNIPPVELVLADDSLYSQKGKIALVEGQFDATIGAISFRASFPNPNGILRSGNTGKIRIPTVYKATLIVPQEATYEIQDKVFVFAVDDSNKVTGKPIMVSGRTENCYFVEKGIKPGERIVLAGTANLREGMVITPQLLSTDSLLKARALSP